ncbi:hypothetical protein Drorol1_Dr00007670, partial [Drosera rotundifolia]
IESPPPTHGGAADFDSTAATLESAKTLILRYDSTASSTSSSSHDKSTIFSSSHDEADRYLSAIDEIQRSLHSVSISGDSNRKLIGIAMSRLEDEFRHILNSQTGPLDTDSLTDHHHGHSHSHGSSSSRRHSVEIADDGHSRDEAARDHDEALSAGDSLDRSFELGTSRSSYRSVSSIREIELLPAEAVTDLRSIAERMIAAGYGRECVQVYSSVRRSSMEENFKRIGIEKRSIGEIERLEWEVLENKIRVWIPAAKICVRTLFASEKSLCEQIFEGLGDVGIDDSCFLETVKAPVGQLFGLADAVSVGRRSPERFFKVMDLYDVFVELLPDIEIVFQSNAAEGIRTQAEEILARLAEAVRGCLSEFENAVLRESSRTPVPGGRIHPLTRYVMNYINLICEYKDSLVEIILTNPSPRHSGDDNVAVPEMDVDELHDRSPLAMHLLWSIVILVSKMEEKSLLYEDPSLAHLFRVNNTHYIVEKAKKSPVLLDMIGDDYFKKLKWKLMQGVNGYVRETWLNVLHLFRDEGLSVRGSSGSAGLKNMLKERFKAFNAKFDEIHKNQAMWLVPDPQLREEIRISITGTLIPAYRSFLGRFGSQLEGSRHSEAYIKYTVEDLEAAVLDLFEGKPITQRHLRRR